MALLGKPHQCRLIQPIVGGVGDVGDAGDVLQPQSDDLPLR